MVELRWLTGQTRQDLLRALRDGPWHIFHFIGHGGFDLNADEGQIVLVDDEGKPDPRPATDLARLLDQQTLRLVVLNICEGAKGSEQDLFSSVAATLMRRNIPAVLAMQYDISDRAAIEFGRAFYETLADGLPIDTAVAEARKAILAVRGTFEWVTPVLHMRSPDGLLFEIADRKPRLLPAPPPTDDRGMLKPTARSSAPNEPAHQADPLVASTCCCCGSIDLSFRGSVIMGARCGRC